MGEAPAELQSRLAVKFLSLLADSGVRPAKILFYTEGVKLACNGTPALEPLRALEAQGVELTLCQTCVDYYGLQDQVAFGVVGGMPDIIEAMRLAGKVITL
jgi:sulfur relay (sulfurtransferase) complex TusBCD TusD component (DsrE family)